MKILINIIIIPLLSTVVVTEVFANNDLIAGIDYIDNKIVASTKPEARHLVTGQTNDSIAVTGIKSIDMLCKQYGIVKVEPFYKGMVKDPELRRIVSGIYIFTLSNRELLVEAIGALNGDPSINIAELYPIPKPLYTPNDSLFGEQWYLSRVRAPEAWDIIRGDTTRHSIIGIVDTGVYWDHPDITPDIWVNEPEDLNNNGILDQDDINGVDDDGNGYIDDVVGWDCANFDNDPREDSPTHGTHGAGCASAATDNDIGIAGIGFSARLMCVKVSNYAGQITHGFHGMIYAAENGAHIINCSWGTSQYSQNYQNIIYGLNSMGKIIVAAAGYDITYPAGYDSVLAVGYVNENDVIFGNGGEWIDLYAPGTNIVSTWSSGSYTYLSGSSMAAPLVSGLAGLVWAKYPYLDNSEIETIIIDGADNIDSLNPGHSGLLRINAANCFTTGIENEELAPNKFSFLRAYPNPFNARTAIEFALVSPGDVELTIYDITGAKVETIRRPGLKAGKHSILWDAKEAASGVYLVRMEAGEESRNIKMVLLK